MAQRTARLSIPALVKTNKQTQKKANSPTASQYMHVLMHLVSAYAALISLMMFFTVRSLAKLGHAST
jgi:hypothetical protein